MDQRVDIEFDTPGLRHEPDHGDHNRRPKARRLAAGAALLAAGFAALSAASAQVPKPKTAGERAFMKCFACHSVDANAKPLPGPSLYKVVGRKIAAMPGYTYSPAMRGFAKTNPRWTRPLLDRFITNPGALVHGTNMPFAGIKDSKERAALVAYLAAPGSAK